MSLDFKIIPSIDLRNGQCVRLIQGDFELTTRYDQDPIEIALKYQAEGAEFLHLVDLDGALTESPSQRSFIQNMVNKTKLRVQVGGGIRTVDQAKFYFDAGVDRIVLGSLAVQDPFATSQIIELFGPNRITLAFDFRDINGEIRPTAFAWKTDVALSPKELFGLYKEWEDLEFLCTDILQDGRLQGIRRDFYQELLASSGHNRIVVSGGAASRADIDLARSMGLRGIILGKALLEKRISLQEALC